MLQWLRLADTDADVDADDCLLLGCASGLVACVHSLLRPPLLLLLLLVVVSVVVRSPFHRAERRARVRGAAASRPGTRPVRRVQHRHHHLHLSVAARVLLCLP